MVCPDVFEMLLVNAVVEHQFQGFGADSFVPKRLSYPVAHLTVVFSDGNVAAFIGVITDAADSLAGHPARGPTSGSEAYLKSASASDSCQWRSKILISFTKAGAPEGRRG